jgi:hypothetical protein
VLLAEMSERVGGLHHEAARWTGRTVVGFIQDGSIRPGANSRCEVPSPLIWPPCSTWSWLLANLTAPRLAAHPGRAERPCPGSPFVPDTQAVRAARTGPWPVLRSG